MVEYHTTDIINGYSFIALAIVVLGALFGSFLINLLNGVKKFAWPISLYVKSSKPIFNFIIPSLIGNILMGFFCNYSIKKNFNLYLKKKNSKKFLKKIYYNEVL